MQEDVTDDLPREERIFCRTEQQTKPAGPGQKLPKPGIVNTPRDLIKLGFTEQEVKAIVSNKKEMRNNLYTDIWCITSD